MSNINRIQALSKHLQAWAKYKHKYIGVSIIKPAFEEDEEDDTCRYFIVEATCLDGTPYNMKFEVLIDGEINDQFKDIVYQQRYENNIYYIERIK